MSVELVCPYCRFSKRISEQKIPAAATMAVCPRCHEKFPLPYRKSEKDPGISKQMAEIPEPDGLEPASVSGDEAEGSPWERRGEEGLFRGIFSTAYKALFQPGELFGTLKQPGGIGEPLAFGLLLGGFGDMMAFFWPALLFSLGLLPFGDFVFPRMNGIWIFLTFFVGIPLAVILNMIIYSGILHLMLLIVRGGKGGYQSTFRVVAYSQAALVWNIIPFMGSWIATVWKLVVQFIGLHEIHHASYFRVMLAFLLPFFILMALVMIALGPLLVLIL